MVVPAWSPRRRRDGRRGLHVPGDRVRGRRLRALRVPGSLVSARARAHAVCDPSRRKPGTGRGGTGRRPEAQRHHSQQQDGRRDAVWKRDARRPGPAERRRAPRLRGRASRAPQAKSGPESPPAWISPGEPLQHRASSDFARDSLAAIDGKTRVMGWARSPLPTRDRTRPRAPVRALLLEDHSTPRRPPRPLATHEGSNLRPTIVIPRGRSRRDTRLG